MFKNLFMFFVLSIVTALPTTAMADVDWLGTIDGEFADANNFASDPVPDQWYTTQITVTAGEYTNAPVISAASGYLQYGLIRVRNSAVLTQTGGTMEWMNGTGTTQGGFALYDGTAEAPSTLNMTGGTMISDDLHVGYRTWSRPDLSSPYNIGPRPYGLANIWGDSTFVVRANPYLDPENPDHVDELYALRISDGSLIDIRDNGVLRVPTGLQTTVDDFITADKIVSGDVARPLYARTDASEYVVSLAIPGDFDLDGDVDVSDLGTLATNYATTSGMAWGDGDATGDAAVDVGDLGILATHYGTGTTIASVPEPGTLLMLYLGIGSLALICRRQA